MALMSKDSGGSGNFDPEGTHNQGAAAEYGPAIATPGLNAAFAKARKEIQNPKFDSENPHFRNKFASLKAVIEATVPVLAKHGIAVIQDIQTINDGIACYTHLCHDSGEEKVFGPLVMNATKSDPQGYASASTYARRYHLMTVTGVAGDADDDGNAASASAFKSKQAKTKARGDIRNSAKESKHAETLQLWDALDNDQKAELWESYGKADRTLITESLETARAYVEGEE